MNERKRFQNKKPDSKDYEKAEGTAKGLKKTFGFGFAALGVFGTVKKYGPQVAKFASNVILKK